MADQTSVTRQIDSARSRPQWLLHVSQNFGAPIVLTVDDRREYDIVFCTSHGLVVVRLPDACQGTIGRAHLSARAAAAAGEFENTIHEAVFQIRTAYPFDAFMHESNEWYASESAQFFAGRRIEEINKNRRLPFFSALVAAGLSDEEIHTIATARRHVRLSQRIAAEAVFERRFADDLHWEDFERSLEDEAHAEYRYHAAA